MSVKDMNMDMYHELLREAGCEIDSEFHTAPNHVWFNEGGLNYLLVVNKGGDGFVEISAPYELSESPKFSDRYKVCNHISRTYKLIKCFYTTESFVVTAEAFVNSTLDFKRFLKYCLASLHVAYEDVVDVYPDGI